MRLTLPDVPPVWSGDHLTRSRPGMELREESVGLIKRTGEPPGVT